MNKIVNNFVLFLLLGSLVKSDILFPKDTSVDFEFPPRIRRSSSGIPDGHLRPLGENNVSLHIFRF